MSEFAGPSYQSDAMSEKEKSQDAESELGGQSIEEVEDKYEKARKYLQFMSGPDEMIEPDEPELPPAQLDVPMVMRRSIMGKISEMTSEQKADFMCQISHIRLDRERIAVIENLECFSTSLTHLYLQHNLIESVSGLSSLPNLVFLCLSNNKIKHIDCDELPKKIIIIYFEGNPCVQYNNYPLNLIYSLPKVKVIDNVKVSGVQLKQAFKLYHQVSNGETRAGVESSSEGETSGSEEEGAKRDTSEGEVSEPEVQGDPRIFEDIEKLLNAQQLDTWRTSYQQVQVLSSSDEDSAEEIPPLDLNNASPTKKKSPRKKKKAKAVKLKTDKEKQNLKKLGINPAHFRDLTVKLLGRSRARQMDDVKSHGKRCFKLDSFREEVQKQVMSERVEGAKDPGYRVSFLKEPPSAPR